jgi:hypothetical protein
VGDTITVTAGQIFIETWRIRNTGSGAWESESGEFQWTFVDGDRLAGPDAVPIVGTVPTGGDYEITAEFTAPSTAGQYETRWQLLDPEGEPVGPVFTTRLTVQDTPTAVAPTEEPEETPTPAPTEAPTTETEEGCLDSYPVSDVTVPDGAEIEPGETFTKIWRIRNTGTCTWDEADGTYTWTFTGGDQMGGPDQVPISGTVESNEEYDVEIELTAPTTPGEYQGFWQLYDPDGEPFGVPFWVLIEVPGEGSSLAMGGPNLVREIWGQIFVPGAVAQHHQMAVSHVGDFHYKGFSNPQPTYSLLGLERDAERFFDQPMVGRQAELERLTAAAQPIFEGQFAGVAKPRPS